MGRHSGRLMSIPNMLSVFRLILVPVFIAAFFLLPREQYYWLAVILFVSGFTDVLDGFIARKFNQITQLGKVLDPAADKITVAAVLFCLMFLYRQISLVLAVYVVKELFMLLGGIILAKRGVKPVSSRWFGKLATFVTYTVMFLFIIIPHVGDIWLLICNVLVIAVTLFALAMYGREFARYYKQSGT